jgi:hypothetical protein
LSRSKKGAFPEGLKRGFLERLVLRGFSGKSISGKLFFDIDKKWEK